MPTVCCTSSGHGGEAEGQGPVPRTRSAGSVPRRRALGSCKRPNTHHVATTLGNMWWEGETFVASKEHPVREHSRPPFPPTGRELERQHHDSVCRKTSQTTTTNTHNTTGHSHRISQDQHGGRAEEQHLPPKLPHRLTTAGIFVLFLPCLLWTLVIL